MSDRHKHVTSEPRGLPTCDRDKGKTIYARRKQALSAAAASRNRTGDRNINTYKCRFASHFHIGHDHFNKDQKPNAHNAALANRKVADVPCVAPPPRPARPPVPQPVYVRKEPDSLVGTVTKAMRPKRRLDEPKAFHMLWLAFSIEQQQVTQVDFPLSLLDFPTCVLSRRASFINPLTGKAVSGMTHSQSITYIPGRTDDTEVFASVFGKFGKVSVPYADYAALEARYEETFDGE